MTKIGLIAIMLAVSSCGPDVKYQYTTTPIQTPYEYIIHISPSCRYIVRSESPINYEDLKVYFRALWITYERHFGKDSLCRETNGMTVWMVNGGFECPYGDYPLCDGYYLSTGIVYNRNSFALLHEFVHAHEAANLVWDTGTHKGWVARGYSWPGREEFGENLAKEFIAEVGSVRLFHER
jgi:hypothetical protein